MPSKLPIITPPPLACGICGKLMRHYSSLPFGHDTDCGGDCFQCVEDAPTLPMSLARHWDLTIAIEPTVCWCCWSGTLHGGLISPGQTVYVNKHTQSHWRIQCVEAKYGR